MHRSPTSNSLTISLVCAVGIRVNIDDLNSSLMFQGLFWLSEYMCLFPQTCNDLCAPAYYILQVSIRLCQKGYQFKCIMYHCCKCIAGVGDYMKVVYLKLPYCRMLWVSSNYNIDLLKTRWSVSKIDQKHFTIFTIWTITAFQIYLTHSVLTFVMFALSLRWFNA